MSDIRVGGFGLRYRGPDGHDALLRGAAAQGSRRQQRGGRRAAGPAHHHRAVGGAQPGCQDLHAHLLGECARTADVVPGCRPQCVQHFKFHAGVFQYSMLTCRRTAHCRVVLYGRPYWTVVTKTSMLHRWGSLDSLRFTKYSWCCFGVEPLRARSRVKGDQFLTPFAVQQFAFLG